MPTSDAQVLTHFQTVYEEAITAHGDANGRLARLQAYLSDKSNFSNDGKTSKRAAIIHSDCDTCAAWTGA
jgi:hypothetical protein